MARLVYSALASLDGYVADEQGDFSWATPDEELHAAANDLSREVGTMLLGRRMYEVLSAWETMDTRDEPAVVGEYQRIWAATDKVVFSGSLSGVETARTRVERTFDPDAVRALKTVADRDLSVGGPTLAALALDAGLVDEIVLFLVPYVVGGGRRVFQPGFRTPLRLLGERRFAKGALMVRYAVGA
jgi:dihydrofolate reductase